MGIPHEFWYIGTQDHCEYLHDKWCVTIYLPPQLMHSSTLLSYILYSTFTFTANFPTSRPVTSTTANTIPNTVCSGKQLYCSSKQKLINTIQENSILLYCKDVSADHNS